MGHGAELTRILCFILHPNVIAKFVHAMNYSFTVNLTHLDIILHKTTLALSISRPLAPAFHCAEITSYLGMYTLPDNVTYYRPTPADRNHQQFPTNTNHIIRPMYRNGVSELKTARLLLFAYNFDHRLSRILID